MSDTQQCVSCAHLEERVSRRWYWCDKQSDWTSLATSCDDYRPIAGPGINAPPHARGPELQNGMPIFSRGQGRTKHS